MGNRVKDIEQHKVHSNVVDQNKVNVKHFSGATVEHMKSYVVPSKEFDNDLYVLHYGTNDLWSSKNPKNIAKDTRPRFEERS